MAPSKILIIQTAFIGDVILATPVLEQVHQLFPGARVDVLVRKGNEGLLKGHPFLGQVWIWEKGEKKYRNLLRLLGQVRKEQYEAVINLQRFFASGMLCALSGAGMRIGFKKNPWSFWFTHAHPHHTDQGQHEVSRNLALLQVWGKFPLRRPALYPSEEDAAAVAPYMNRPFVCMAPTSVWFTKQWPAEQWVKLAGRIPAGYIVYLLGGPADRAACESVAQAAARAEIVNLAGKLSLLQSCALMRHAAMNYVNDSAPMHMASAMNAPTTAIFCSTVPAFGFGPLAEQSRVVEHPGPLACRPCGLHGKAACPEGHFKCAREIDPAAVPLPGDGYVS